MRALVSIHDLMPETFDRVKTMLAEMPREARHHLVLLVVPGRNWTREQINCLREWQTGGLILAAHGWDHEAKTIAGWYHRCHSRLLSRNVAEHLSLSPGEISTLLQRSFDWFGQQDLKSPDLYVPPAWAMGRVDKTLLRNSPFRYFETTWGIYDSHNAHFKWLPLMGFEADTSFRKWSLRGWNFCNRLVAFKRPVRVSLHPFDLEYFLLREVKRTLSQVDNLDYHDVFS